MAARRPPAVAELRQRTERLQTFPDLESVETELLKLITYSEGPIIACLPAGPGRRVAQYAQLLTGEPSGPAPQEEIVTHSPAISAPSTAGPSPEDQVWKQRMEMEIDLLKAQLTRLKVRLGVED